MDGFEPKLHYEDFNDAMHDLVLSLGGYKKVGPMLWPEKPLDDAAGLLRHCLNRTRREKLDGEQLLFLMRKAREINFHGAKYFFDEATGYQKSAPLNPKDEAEELQRRSEALVAELKHCLDRQERLTRAPLAAVR